MRIKIAPKSSFVILAHYFNSLGYYTHWWEYVVVTWKQKVVLVILVEYGKFRLCTAVGNEVLFWWREAAPQGRKLPALFLL
jgi:hypothetical protein